MVRHDIGGYAGVFANRRDAVAFEERVIDGSRFGIELPALKPLSDGGGDTADADRRRTSP